MIGQKGRSRYLVLQLHTAI